MILADIPTETRLRISTLLQAMSKAWLRADDEALVMLRQRLNALEVRPQRRGLRLVKS